MERNDYSRLIYENKIEELKNIYNLNELTDYQYLHKYLLEYLLETGYHDNRMDSRAKKDELWAELYVKYNILKPLKDADIAILLQVYKNDLIIDKVLPELTNEEKIDLYKRIKYKWIYLFSKFEPEILASFKKNGLNIPTTYISEPKITDKKTVVKGKLNEGIRLFKKFYPDMNNSTMDLYIEEIKENSKLCYRRSVEDIAELIVLKGKLPDFKLLQDRIKLYNGEYDENKSIVIDKYMHGIFAHEMSHNYFARYDIYYNIGHRMEYNKIKKNIVNEETEEKINIYLNQLHLNDQYMFMAFKEIYFKKLENKYGSITNFKNHLYAEMIAYQTDEIYTDLKFKPIYVNHIDEDISKNEKNRLIRMLDKFIEKKADEYADICTKRYYTEYFYLENLLDALFDGKIYLKNKKVYYATGHTRSYFKRDRLNSFDECIANYSAIKLSKHSTVVIEKLRELVGDELVDLFDDYLKEYRHIKTKKLKKQR